MHPRNISIKEFNYELTDEKIAKYPLPERDASKLLIYKDGKINEDIYKNISAHLPPYSSLVFNNTKVVEARLLFEKTTGGLIEIFCLEPYDQYIDPALAMMQQGKVLWKCLVGGASKWKHGQVLEKKIRYHEQEVVLRAAYIEKKEGSFIIELSWSPYEISFAEVLHHAGAIPLPPYIKRTVEESDANRYQTIYALSDGSVAAPTAGLHFSDAIFEQLPAKNIQTGFVTLHVGAGTFKPVKSETLADHEMHAEFIRVDQQMIQYLVEHTDETIIAVGTTSLRTIESLYWLGVKLGCKKRDAVNEHTSPEKEDTGNVLTLHQWEVYDHPEQAITVKEALENLLIYLRKNNSSVLFAKTQILIAPGYRFRIIKALITNFHQPQSTLLLLIAALIGDDWKKVYAHALENNFRFLSYGDGSLLWGK